MRKTATGRQVEGNDPRNWVEEVDDTLRKVEANMSIAVNGKKMLALRGLRP